MATWVLQRRDVAGPAPHEYGAREWLWFASPENQPEADRRCGAADRVPLDGPQHSPQGKWYATMVVPVTYVAECRQHL